MAGLLTERMQKKLAYVLEENRVLREVIDKRRIPLSDSQRRRLAIKGKLLSPRDRAEVCGIVRPETLLLWFRKLVCQKYDGSIKRGPGRRRTPADVRGLVLRFAGENASWGYTRIRDALAGVGVSIGRTTVADLLRQAGIDPAPRRRKGMDWKDFLSAHWQTLYACDFLTVETLGLFGPVRYLVFFVMEVHSRRVHIAGIRMAPDGPWMIQVARNLTDCIDGFLKTASHLICDRDPLFTRPFRKLLRRSGVRVLRLPSRSPNLNPHAERFVRSIKEECLSRFIILGERHLRHLVSEYADHYHTGRHHQGLDGKLISGAEPANTNGRIRCRKQLGGTLRYYHRGAA